jgi:hypothetical protein
MPLKTPLGVGHVHVWARISLEITVADLELLFNPGVSMQQW